TPAPPAPRSVPPPPPPPAKDHLMTTTVLGIDSSTQATKALLVDAATGEVLEERRASHPDGTEVDPRAWLAAVDEAAGPLLERAEAVASADSSTAWCCSTHTARWCATRCCGTTPAPPRRPRP